GGADRQYMYGNLTYMPLKEIFLYSTVTADVNQNTKKPGLTNASIELVWRPDFTKSFTVGYNRFQAIRYYRSMAFNIYDSRQEGYYIGANYRIAERYGVYGRLERQYRYTTPAVPAGYDASTIYRVGLTGDNIMDAGINMNISASVVDNYASRNDSYSIDVSKLYREVLQLVFTGSYNRNTYDITTSSDNVYTLGASGYWLINKSWNASLALDREQGETYSTNRLMTRVTFKF
ncbi:MAG: hypothetical protein HZB21_05180, partial [Deltaproteobacteria bacterium]|nr:hypothetical protein [Deltaproteobacteria bacterium]